MAQEWNGEARIAFKRPWRRDVWAEVVRPAKITPKLVRTGVERFDRATGRDRSRYSPHVKARRLVAYRMAGGEWVSIDNQPPEDDGISGQDRESYSDTQDRESYSCEPTPDQQRKEG